MMDERLFCPAYQNTSITNQYYYKDHEDTESIYEHYSQYGFVLFTTFIIHFVFTSTIEVFVKLRAKTRIRKEKQKPAETVIGVTNEEEEEEDEKKQRLSACQWRLIYKKSYSSTINTYKSGEHQKPGADTDFRAFSSDHNGSQENVLEYRVGGYKPISIGEELGDYRVIRKLGYGHFSTVWLCSDKRENTEKYVAVKVVKSIPMCDNMAREEIKLLNQLVNIEPNHNGRRFIIEMMDYFHVNSVNGKHVCIAFELMGPSLLHLITQSNYQGIYEPAVKSIIKQVLVGLTYLHTACKVIHTDLKPENILIKVTDAYIKNMVDRATRYSELGIPMPRSYISAESYEHQGFEAEDERTYEASVLGSSRINRSSSFPQLMDITNESEIYSRRITSKKELYVSPKIEVKIADMGNACWQNDKIDGTIQTKQYRALEVLLGSEYDTPADIWSVGCIAFELATGEFLFNPRRTSTYSSTEDHILLIYELLGGIPPYIAAHGRKSHRFFDAAGELTICSSSMLHIWKTEDVLVEKYEWKRVAAIPFASILNGMIEPDPELRLTAESALAHQWLSDSSTAT